MRFSPPVSIVSSILLLGTSAACGDSAGAKSSPAYVAPDAAVDVPPLPAAPSPITVIVKGRGHVVASDGSFDCGESGGLDGGTCQPPHYNVTLYAAPYITWAFDHWEPSMSTNGSLQLESWTANPITAVFVDIEAGLPIPAPIDSGSD